MSHGDGRERVEIGERSLVQPPRAVRLQDALVRRVQRQPVQRVEQLRLGAPQVEARLFPDRKKRTGRGII